MSSGRWPGVCSILGNGINEAGYNITPRVLTAADYVAICG
jgi:hypothetical protein